MRSAEKFNPMKAPVTKIGTGPATLTKNTAKMGAGKQMGPSIATGYAVSGTSNPRATGGPFAKANTAKKSK